MSDVSVDATGATSLSLELDALIAIARAKVASVPVHAPTGILLFNQILTPDYHFDGKHWQASETRNGMKIALPGGMHRIVEPHGG